jgi:hypothetical protein
MAVRSSRITSPERSESFNKDDSTRRGVNVIIDVDGDGLPFPVPTPFSAENVDQRRHFSSLYVC